jgi:hypothetical protein
VPKSGNHNGIVARIDTISDDVGAGSERYDQLAIAKPRRGTTAFRLIGERARGSKQRIDCPF